MSVFPNNPDCPLPDITPINHDLVKKCDIPGAPDPIFQGLEFPPIPVPPSIGCAEILTDIELVRVDAEPIRFDIDIEYKDNDFCFPKWNFDINIPCDCTEIKNGDIKVKGGELIVEFKKVEPPPDPEDPCNCNLEFDFDLKIDDPCQAIDYGDVTGVVVVDDHYSLTGGFKKDPNDDCAVSMDLELHLKNFDLDPCLILDGGDITGTVTTGAPEVTGSIILTPDPDPEGGCALTAEIDIVVPEIACEDAQLLNQSAERAPKGAAIKVTSYSGDILRGTKPDEANLTNIVFAAEAIEPGEEGPIVYSSGGGCTPNPTVRIDGAVVAGDSIGTIADSWSLSKDGIGFTAMADGSSHTPVKSSSGGASGLIYKAIETQDVSGSVESKQIGVDGSLADDPETLTGLLSDYEITKEDLLLLGTDKDGQPMAVSLNDGRVVMYKALTDEAGGTVDVQKVTASGTEQGISTTLPIFAGIVAKVSAGAYLMSGKDAEGQETLIPLNTGDSPANPFVVPTGDSDSADLTEWDIESQPDGYDGVEVEAFYRLHWSGNSGDPIYQFNRSAKWASNGFITYVGPEVKTTAFSTGSCIEE